jgi:hypothetical protein
MISHDRAQELLSDRLDGPLSLSDARALQDHLRGCAHCRAMADVFGGLATELRVLPSLPPSPAVSRAVLEHVQTRRPAWGWLRSGLGAVGSPAMAAASGLALVAALAGTIFLAVNGGVDPEAERTPVSAIVAVAPAETPTPTPATTVAAPIATNAPDPTNTPTPQPTATQTPRATATATATATQQAIRTAHSTATATATATVAPSASDPTPVPTETRELAQAPSSEPNDSAQPTPPPAEVAPASGSSEAPEAARVPGVVEAGQAAGPVDTELSDAPAEPNEPEEPRTDEPALGAGANAAMISEETPPETAQDTPPETADELVNGLLAGESSEMTRAADDGTPAAAEAETEPTVPPEWAVIDEPTPTVPAESAPDEGTAQQPAAPAEENWEPTPPPIEPGDGPNGVSSEPPGASEPPVVPTITPVEQAPQEVPTADVAAEQVPPQEPIVDPDVAPEVTDEQAPVAPEVVPTEAPAAAPDGDIGAATVIGAGDPGSNPVVSPAGAVLTVATAADGVSTTAAAPDASGAPVPIDPTDEPHTDTPLGWVGGQAYYQRAYPDGRLELRAGSPGAGGFPVWSGVNGGVFSSGIGQARFTPGGDRIAFLSGGALYVAPTGDPNAAAAVAVPAVVGFDWSPGGDQLIVSDGYALSVFGASGEGPLIVVGNQGGIPIGTVDWREDGIAVGRYDTGEMVLIPLP